MSKKSKRNNQVLKLHKRRLTMPTQGRNHYDHDYGHGHPGVPTQPTIRFIWLPVAILLLAIRGIIWVIELHPRRKARRPSRKTLTVYCTCRRTKKIFPTQQRARRAASRWRYLNPYQHWNMRAYIGACGHWHIGHKNLHYRMLPWKHH